jgi:hypothetical protein
VPLPIQHAVKLRHWNKQALTNAYRGDFAAAGGLVSLISSNAEQSCGFDDGVCSACNRRLHFEVPSLGYGVSRREKALFVPAMRFLYLESTD